MYGLHPIDFNPNCQYKISYYIASKTIAIIPRIRPAIWVAVIDSWNITNPRNNVMNPCDKFHIVPKIEREFIRERVGINARDSIKYPIIAYTI